VVKDQRPAGAVPVLFYSAWPLGYHNPEAQRKALAFAESGHRVTYVTGVGIRNPRPSSATKIVDRGLRKLRHGGRTRPALHPNLRTAALVVCPPRQVPAVRRLNRRWVRRQLLHAVPDIADALAWVRWPTPELVDALADLRPRAVVYERVDAYERSPGVRGRWERIYEAAESRLVDLADAVVVSGDVLAAPIRTRGVEPHVVPHGVDLFPWRERDRSGTITVGFVGTLDYRLDRAVLRHVAEHHPDWHVRLAGPVQEGFDPEALADLPNVSIEPPVPHERLWETLAEFDAGIMPYSDHPACAYLTPVKNLELMAAGRPVVARPLASLQPFAETLYFADSPAEFSAQLERALREDDVDRALARRAVAERNSWAMRMETLRTIVQKALEGNARAPSGRF
jgi:glycosyltransferase involved in cell wall biosynthesis